MEAINTTEAQPVRNGSIVARHFRIERLCHTSTSSRLYQVSHVVLGYSAMLKVLSQPSASWTSAGLEGLGTLDHPCCTRILASGTLAPAQGSHPFLVREFAPGQPLTAWIKRKRRLTPIRTVQIMIGVLGALGEAHARGIIHGDIKPDNIIVSGVSEGLDQTKLIDFGAPLREGDHSGTSGVRAFAAPKSAAPEVLRGNAPDARSDLYSLGLVLYECISGVRPEGFATVGENGSGARAAVQLPPLASVVPTSARLSEIVVKATARRPEDRFQSAASFVQALASLQCAELSSFGEFDSDLALQNQETPHTVDITAHGKRQTASPKSRRSWQGDHAELLSTVKPTLWVLGGDPGTDHPLLKEVVLAATARYDVRLIDSDGRDATVEQLRSGAIMPPWVLVFGDLHVLLEDVLIQETCRLGETSRLLVSTHGNFELLHSTVNACGLHSQVCLPANREEVQARVEAMVERTRRQRQRYDRVRLALRDAQADIQALRGTLARRDERRGHR